MNCATTGTLTIAVVSASLAACTALSCGEAFVSYVEGSPTAGAGGEGGQGGKGGSAVMGGGGEGGAIASGGGGSGMGGGGGAGGMPPCRGLAFNGIEQFVQVPDHAHLDGMSQITVEAWAHLKGSVAAAFVSHADPAADGFLLEHKNNKALTFRMFLGGGSYSDGGSVLTLLQQDVWTHVAGVFDGGEIRLYVDGALLDSNAITIPGGTIGDFAGVLRIGAHANGSGYFEGMMDEVRISDVPRYVGSSFQPPAGPFVPDANTVALWHFDEPGGQPVLDATGLHDGTLGASNADEPSDPVRLEVPCISDML